MKISVENSLEHGVLFLYDPYMNYSIPYDTGAGEFTSTDSSVCFWVPSYIDALARVVVSEQPFKNDRLPDFERRIKAPGKSIALADVPQNYYCLLKLKNTYADIRIWNYESGKAKRSWVQILNIAVF